MFIFHVLPCTTHREQLQSGIFIWHYAKIILIFHCSSFNTLQEAETIALYWEVDTLGPTSCVNSKIGRRYNAVFAGTGIVLDSSIYDEPIVPLGYRDRCWGWLA